MEKCVRKQCPAYGEVAGCREAMLGVEEALLGMGEQLGVWRTNAGCVEKHCWVCGEVCKEAMLGVGEAVSSVGKTLQRADKRV